MKTTKQMRNRWITGLVLAVLTCASGTVASAQRTWIVDATGGGDFADIPPAVAAASAGDRILVQPAGDYYYSRFTLRKGLQIRATTGRFRVVQVTVEGITGPFAAGVSHAQVEDTVRIDRCTSEVILEGLSFEEAWGYSGSCLVIEKCFNVAVNDLRINTEELSGLFPSFQPAVRIQQSRVRMDSPAVRGCRGGEGGSYGADGDTGLLVDRSYLALSSPRIRGGPGGIASSGWGSYPTAGGDAVIVDGASSEVVILGTDDDFIKGGAGGNAGFGGVAPGGDGLVVRAGTVTVSRVVLEGGSGVPDGDAEVGPVNHFDELAVLGLTSDLHLGSDYQLQVDAVHPGGVVLLFSDTGGFWRLDNVLGPQLSAVPGGGVFKIYDLGRTDRFGDWSWDLTMASDPSYLGTSWTYQIGVLQDRGGTCLTNAVTRTIGE